MARWDPSQYERYKAERAQPFHDLLALVRPAPGLRIVDLGCGTGALTRGMHDTLGAAETIGVDLSEPMLAASAPHATPTCRFVRGDLATWTAEHPVDLVLSNAALHWVNDHDALLARLAGMLAPGGQIAVQVPANHDHASHLAAEEVAREAPFEEALRGHVRRTPVLAPEAYATLLDRLGFTEQSVRLQVYAHHLPSRDDVVEWVKGTLLTDYEARLPPELYARFLARYREALFARVHDDRPFLFTFKRILFWGRRGEGR